MWKELYHKLSWNVFHVPPEVITRGKLSPEIIWQINPLILGPPAVDEPGRERERDLLQVPHFFVGTLQPL